MNNIDYDNPVYKTTSDRHCKPGIFRRFMLRRRALQKRRRLQRLVEKLDLEASQREALEAVFTELDSLKASAFSSSTDVVAGLAAAIRDESFDKAVAARAVQQPIDTVELKMDAVLQRFGEWFNALNEAQRQHLRELIQSRFVLGNQ